MADSIPAFIRAHAKKHGMTVAKDPQRDVGIYQMKGKALISFNLSDAKTNKAELLAQLDQQLARMEK